MSTDVFWLVPASVHMYMNTYTHTHTEVCKDIKSNMSAISGKVIKEELWGDMV